MASRRASRLCHRYDPYAPARPLYACESSLTRGSCSGYAVLRGEEAPDDALASELGAMGLL